MKLWCKLCFEECDGVLKPLLTNSTEGYISGYAAQNFLQVGTYTLGSEAELKHMFGESCMARCTIYCIISLFILRWSGRLPSTPVTTVLLVIYGFTFIAAILRVLDAKVEGFTDRGGICVSFKNRSITFADGAKYFFA